MRPWGSLSVVVVVIILQYLLEILVEKTTNLACETFPGRRWAFLVTQFQSSEMEFGGIIGLWVYVALWLVLSELLPLKADTDNGC